MRQRLFYLISFSITFVVVYFFLQPLNSFKDLMAGEQFYNGGCHIDTKYYRKRGRVCYVDLFQKNAAERVEANTMACKQLVKATIYSNYGFYEGVCQSNITAIYLKNSKSALLIKADN